MATHKHTHSMLKIGNTWNCNTSSRIVYALKYTCTRTITFTTHEYGKSSPWWLSLRFIVYQMQHSFALHMHDAHTLANWHAQFAHHWMPHWHCVQCEQKGKKRAKENPVIRACSPTILLLELFLPPIGDGYICVFVLARVWMFLFPVRVSSWYSCGAMHYLPLDVLFSFKVFQHSKIAIKCIECRGEAEARGRGERANEASNIVPVGLTLYTWAIYTMQTDKYTQFDFIYIVCIYTHANTHRHMQQKYILKYRMSKYWHTDSHAISHPLYILLSIRAMNTSEYIRDCLNCSYRI